ncbi:alpha-amylase [Novosphingobium marinum]|uniref:Maltokinase n=1 Tax=Novosphingobium marinum TaxID=1514948 RepID=A0A7Y9XVE3_9SPHN|nr:maltose alpha-D-glucosyltransferase [Novosphingobium marinum]NYH95289.1 maltose alpha-D-glucosyltransferase/alpha-amylase [Novosphingobium marinum]GGC25850.1 alpha-amylase [Novosphingobium marinum]
MNEQATIATGSATITGSEDPQWYKDAVIYQVHVKSFYDSNNDGIGDFAGLMQKLDYIADLGVNAIWLLPFYPSPRRDDGYDIAEYREVSPDYGTMEDARAFIEAAHDRGIRVITELVINHTSDQHPWFQAARKAPPGSPERDFYVWSDDDKLYSGTRIIFLDTEKSNWTWDEEAGAYFWHRFYSHQPDLNFENPRVLEEVLSVMHFWLDAGVDGLRLDAIPYLIERDGTSNENLQETHEVLKKIRADLDAHYEGKMLLAEANMWPEDTQQYFGQRADRTDECHMAFHFPLMPRMYMAVAQEDRFPITDILRQTPAIPEDAQWAIFLRNHDELTLEMVTDAERDYLWNTYAADRRARINLGIRRRLAPLMERDRRRIELMNALLLTMPGTPVLYYGDELGMGDNIFLGDRDGVRTPMQWSPDRNGGFSRADPASLTLPPIQDPLYGYEAINVEAQERDRHSLLNWVKRMLAVRGAYQAFGRGTLHFLRPANRRILAYVRRHEGSTILCVANLSRTAQAVELDLHEFEGLIPMELSGGAAFPAVGQLPYLLTLPPYGFLWFELTDEADAPDWASAAPGAEVERHTFVLRPDLLDVTKDGNREVLERDVLPAYIPHRRWFGAKDEAIGKVSLVRATPMPAVKDLLLGEVEVATKSGSACYTLPLGIAWEGDQHGPYASNLAIARVRRERYVGLLTDGFALADFARSVLSGMAGEASVESEGGALEFRKTAHFDLEADAEPEWIAAEQSNSTMILGRKAVLKLLRKVAPGVHPDAEMAGYLANNGFANVPPVLGTVVRTDGADETTLMIAQAFVYNQGDGWQWTLGALERLSTETDFTFSNYENFAENLGRKLAAMHGILARPTDNADFAPEAVSAEEAKALGERIVGEFDRALSRLASTKLEEGIAADAAFLSDNRSAIEARIRKAAGAAQGKARTRIHGDLHLGQVLVTGNDVMIIDFEGEPTRPLAERRAKDLPARDIAGMVRSFDYAAAVAEEQRPAGAETWETRADERATLFRRSAITAFLKGYFGDDEPDPILGLFIIEKAAYEVSYEAANRPDWIGVPVAGLARAARDLIDGDSA